MEKKLDGNFTRMLWTILNKSWSQHLTKQQLYGHLPPIMKTIKVRRIRHVGHCWRSRDKLISDVLLWTPSHGRAKAGWPARTYIQQLCSQKTCRKQWTLERGGKKGSGISMLLMIARIQNAIDNYTGLLIIKCYQPDYYQVEWEGTCIWARIKIFLVAVPNVV